MPNKPDSERQEAFCEFYVRSFGNGVKSAINAGYAPKAARSKASQLLTKVNIQARIKELKVKLHDELMITPEDLVQRLATITRFDPRNMFNEDNKLKHITEMDTAEAMNIQEMEITSIDGDEVTTKVKFGKDYISAMDKMMKFFGKYEADNEKQEIHIHLDSKDAQL